MSEDDAETLLRATALSTERVGFSLQVTSECDHGATVHLDPQQPTRVLVGTGPAADLRLSDPTVSRRHVALSVLGSELRVEDLRSTNGTFVNGVRFAEAFLRGGERLRVGQTTLSVEARASENVGAATAECFGPLIGSSPAMRRLYPLMEKVAGSDVTVLIEGETGTGKEIAAEALHERSARRNGPFVVFDCTAVPGNLMEASLFGHERGAFTGAHASRLGVFEEADGGTLLIDEIGDLEMGLQPKLLRALQQSEVRRVGSTRSTSVNVRVLAATRRDLDREVQAGRFRDDLFFRLNVVRFELPPLRERRGDVAVLARHFWDKLGGAELPLPVDLFESWEDYAWPGNVRELENAVVRRLALGELAPPLPRSPAKANASLEVPFDPTRPLVVAREQALQVFEHQYLERLLALHDGDTAKAAQVAGVTRRYLNMLRARRSS